MPKNEKPSGWNFACAAISTCASALLFSTHAGVAGAAVAACGAGACADAATGRVNARAMARTSGFMVSVSWKADATLRRAQRAGNAPQVTRVQIGRAHVCTPVTNAHLVFRPLLDKKQHSHAVAFTTHTTEHDLNITLLKNNHQCPTHKLCTAHDR